MQFMNYRSGKRGFFAESRVQLPNPLPVLRSIRRIMSVDADDPWQLLLNTG